MKKAIPILFLILLQGCMTWSRQWNLGICRESSAGVHSCAIKVPKSSEVVSVGARIVYPTEKHATIKSLRIRIENEEPHIIQIQGISPSVLLKPKEAHEFTVQAGPAFNTVDGAYICAFPTGKGSIRVKLDILNENLTNTIIKIIGSAGYGP
jgi:hypothetical protein